MPGAPYVCWSRCLVSGAARRAPLPGTTTSLPPALLSCSLRGCPSVFWNQHLRGGALGKRRGEHFHKLGENPFEQLETLEWGFGGMLVAEDDSPPNPRELLCPLPEHVLGMNPPRAVKTRAAAPSSGASSPCHPERSNRDHSSHQER